MARNQTVFTEPLYLDKNLDGKKVLIPALYAKRLTLQQRDGIRFLYRVFKKKDPGVILNDPSDFGDTVQVILFLNSIKNIPDNFSSLILCNSALIADWKQQIETWSEDSNDVIYESDNQFANKKIFVNCVDNVTKFNRRKWTVLIIDTDEKTDGKILKQLSLLKADYKIWITNENLKKDLNSFAAIYKWINPHENFDTSVFTADPKDSVDVRKKKVLLDYFLDDILLRRAHKEPKFNSTNYIANRTDPTQINQKMLKNKDPTGTKVKCSKKRKQELLQKSLIDNVDVSPSNSDNKVGDNVKDFDAAIAVGGGVELDTTADIIQENIIILQSEIHSVKKAKGSDTTITDKDDNVEMFDDVEKFISEKKPVECDWSDYIEQEIISKKPDDGKKDIMIDNLLSEYF